jgi:endogenous inhibitor of DNA gyrase (YacG/DUF329 family)
MNGRPQKPMRNEGPQVRVGHNSECQTCHGLGGWLASTAAVCKDEKTFHETPEAVLDALRDSQTGFAVVTCPTCGGTGEWQ